MRSARDIRRAEIERDVAEGARHLHGRYGTPDFYRIGEMGARALDSDRHATSSVSISCGDKELMGEFTCASLCTKHFRFTATPPDFLNEVRANIRANLRLPKSQRPILRKTHPKELVDKDCDGSSNGRFP